MSGAGIGTIQSTPDAPPASASLIAPRGTVNAGDAGLRSSGDLAVIALRVLNAANRGSQTVAKQLPSLITVEVLGFGDCDPEAGKKCQE